MADAFTGEVRILPYSYAPVDWAFCAGQQIYVQQNPALYSIIGTHYGGSGSGSSQSFNLPNFQGTVPIGMGQGPGLTNRQLTNPITGSNSVTLTSSQTASHTHTVTAKTVGPAAGPANMTASPAATNDSWLSRAALISTSGTTTTNLPIASFTANSSPNAVLAPQIITPAGGTAGTVAGHENRQPFLPINFCICINGYYPVRN